MASFAGNSLFSFRTEFLDLTLRHVIGPAGGFTAIFNRSDGRWIYPAFFE